MSDVTARSGAPITIRHVSKTFGEDTDVPFRALKEVNATIPAGQFVSIVGASGCGKSTLMLMIAGLLKRSAGDILVGHRPVTAPTPTSASRSRTTYSGVQDGVRQRDAPLGHPRP